MVAHVPACVLDPARLARRLLRLSMVAARTPGAPQPQDIVCPRPCQWERTDTRPDFGTINPPRAARTPGGRPDGRTVDPSPPAFTWTGPAAGPSVARAPADRQRYPSRYNSRYGARVALARPARGARGSERRQAPGRRQRHQRRTDGRTRTRGAARSAILDHAPFSPCSPYQTMLEYANMCKNTLSYLQMFADILRFRKEIKKFDFFAIWACAGARNVVDFRRFPDKGLRARRRKEKAIPFWRLYVRPAMAPSRRATAELLNGARRP